jgi:uncharacterized protein (DUF305 family)
MKSILFSTILISFLVGIGATYAIMKPKLETSTATSNTVSNMGMSGHNMADMSMSSMNSELKDRSGDDFDKAFLEMMIEHHQGAIDMANAAKDNAKHSEIKAMADDIISAQSNEIEQMKNWQKQWGY